MYTQFCAIVFVIVTLLRRHVPSRSRSKLARRSRSKLAAESGVTSDREMHLQEPVQGTKQISVCMSSLHRAAYYQTICAQGCFKRFLRHGATTTVTRIVLTEGEEQVAGKRDNSVESMARQSAAGNLLEAPQLDEALDSFFSNNYHQGKHYTFDEILRITETLYFKFEHAGMEYRASVSLLHGPVRDIVVLLLPDNNEDTEEVLDEHFFWDERMALPRDEAMDLFPKLHRNVSPQYSRAVVMYKNAAQRTGIMFEPMDAAAPVFLVSHEPGHPYLDRTRFMCAF